MKDLPTTKHGFLSKLGVLDWETSYGWICRKCNLSFYYNLFEKASSVIKCSTCDDKPNRQSDHYIIFDLEQTLQKILPFLHQNSNESQNDLFYRYKLRKRFPSSTDNDFTLVLNTDGVPLYKSSKRSLWPVLGTICFGNLHQQKLNVIMLGLWVGVEKPDFEHFLWKIINQINDISERGVIYRKLDGLVVKSRLFLSHIMCDSIARPLVQGTSQFNAIYGCNFCYHKSATSEGYKSHFYRHDNSYKDVRSMASMLADLNEIKCNGESRGVKRESPFLKVPNFDLIFGFPPDVMHCCYLGVTRQFTNTWFNSNNNAKPYYLGGKQSFDKINSSLCNICPPNRMNRTPRGLENRKFYKAHEWQAWLLYYSPIVLKDTLSSHYYYHWLTLVQALSILTSSHVNEIDIQRAQDLMVQFSEQVHELYDVSQCTYNVHLLLHLPTFVRYYGPLQYISMFSFENYNQVLLKYVTGTQFVAHQIAKRYIQDMIQKYNLESQNPQSEYSLFLKSIRSKGSLRGLCVIEQHGILHECASFHPTLPSWSCLSYYMEVGVKFFKKYKRSSDNVEFYGKRHVAAITRNNCCVRIRYNLAILIETFMYVSQTKEMFAVGYLHSLKKSDNLNLNHFNQSVGFTNGCLPCTSLKDIMMYIEKDNDIYFVDFLNYADNNNST